MKTKAIIERGADGTFSAYTPDLDSVILGEGKTSKEAMKNLQQNYSEIIDSYTEVNEPVPEELTDLEFEYHYDIASCLSFLDYFNISKFARAIGMDPSLLRHYKNGSFSASSQQARKLEDAIHELGRKMQRISLL